MFRLPVRPVPVPMYSTAPKRPPKLGSGSVGLKVGRIVERDCDLYIHVSNKTRQWDACAPDIILREAGGIAFLELDVAPEPSVDVVISVTPPPLQEDARA